jgi:hypothetical protein
MFEPERHAQFQVASDDDTESDDDVQTDFFFSRDKYLGYMQFYIMTGLNVAIFH